ncbi:hypothetical protein AVEN_259315-1 [Araneus ventricosus]|uniref:Uncharacterized protein n=1 Tax=Araneus ventricosus TaxID=182803 RepID=A0A4Y2GJ00_ARAVE|nr:hypothetical protein AVEN_259315-1 [Araneus ventricosus]
MTIRRQVVKFAILGIQCASCRRQFGSTSHRKVANSSAPDEDEELRRMRVRRLPSSLTELKFARKNASPSLWLRTFPTPDSQRRATHFKDAFVRLRAGRRKVWGRGARSSEYGPLALRLSSKVHDWMTCPNECRERGDLCSLLGKVNAI